MPFGPGTYGPETGGAGLAGPAQARQGIPQPGIMPVGAPTEQAMGELVQMLRGGQVGAERFLQLLSLLAGSSLPQMDPDQAMGAQAPRPGAAPAAQGGASIASLLGG